MSQSESMSEMAILRQQSQAAVRAASNETLTLTLR